MDRQSRPAIPDSRERPTEWVRLGIGLGAAVFFLVALLSYLLLPRTPAALQQRARELTTAVLCLFAFGLERTRRREASLLALFAIWLEPTLAISWRGTLAAESLLVYPPLVVFSGLLIGDSMPLGIALATAAALLGGVGLHRVWDGLPFLPRDELHWYFVSTGVNLVSALLTRAGLNAYQRAISVSEAARSRYTQLFESAPDGLVALDAAGRISEANPAAARLLGQRREALVGQRFSDVLAAAGAATAFDPALARPGAPLLVELSGAQPRWFEISSQTAEPGDDSGALLVVRDVGQRKQLEARMAHTQRLETVGLLAGGVAHDFNNLLTAVGGYAAILQEKPDPDTQELAGEILQAQARGTSLTRQLLAFARRDLQRPSVIDLASTVSGTARLIERLLGEQHRLTLTCEGMVPVLADPSSVEQVAVNLASNARDAMPGGGTVAISICSLEGRAAARLGSTLPSGPQAMLEVADSGVGMSADVRARIFEPFFTTKPRGQGTGLGLSTVHGIVAQSGGQIAVESAPGAGARFRVFLPLLARPLGALSSGARIAAPRGRERVLLVEDDRAVRDLSLRALTGAGYQVSAAYCGEEALRLAAGSQFDLLLSDVVMPGMGGPALAERLRVAQPGLCVLFVSGYFETAQPGTLDPQRNLLHKPFTAEQLLVRVRGTLDGGGDIGTPPRGARKTA